MEAARSSNAAPSSCRPKRIPSRFRLCCDSRPHRREVPPPPCRSSIQPLPRKWGAKRARTALPCHSPDTNTSRREWADLGDDLAGLIAERVLAYDVADYLRFRAVCRSWRRCSVDPRAHGCLDRRFHPRRWIMLRELLANPDCRQFLNISTGECVQVDIPELHDHELLAVTSEGLLVLVRNPHRTAVHMLNPLTRHHAELPPFTTLLRSKNHRDILSWCNFGRFIAWGSGMANDDSTVVLCLRLLDVIGVATLGDLRWKVLKIGGSWRVMASSMLAGRFYCVTREGVMVLEDQPPRLKLAAELPMKVSSMTDSVHLVDCAGELVLVHRRFSRRAWNNLYNRRYDAYRVDFDARTLCQVNSFGGGRHALFIGMTCSFSVPIEAFPSGSIRGDTIYFSFSIDERNKTEGYNFADRRTISGCNLARTSSVEGPHTLVDCLSFSSTVWIRKTCL